MARTKAALPAGSRITDYISLGVIAKFVPLAKVREIFEQTSRTSIRERDLPAHVVVYYVIALALYMRSSYREVLRFLLEGVKWLIGPAADVKVTGDSGISQARTRLGAGTAGAVGPTKRLGVFRRISHVQGAAIQAHQTPLPIPCPFRILICDRGDDRLIEPLQRFGP